MSSLEAPKNPDKPSGNPYPKRGQIKVRIITDLASFIRSAGRRWQGDAEEHETGNLLSPASADDHGGYPVPDHRDD